jgi:DNA-binding response OmpR family regulator
MNNLLENLRANVDAPRTLNPSGAGRHILVVEDNEVLRKLNVLVLGHSGYRVDDAEDGAAGWELLNARTFDVLITDHEMPRLSGLDLVKQARSSGMTLPIIMATGRLPEEELERLPWLQLDATLLKPYSPEQLRQAVKRVLCSNRAGVREHSCFASVTSAA